jgi:hypothetical protein
MRLAYALLFLCACTPSPERVCARKMRLSEERFGRTDPATRKRGIEHCLELARAEKQADPKKYKCRADCFLEHKRLDDAAECDKRC